MSVSDSPRIRNRSGVRVKRRRRSFLRTVFVPLLARIVVVAVALAIGTWLVCKVLRPIRLFSNEQREKDRIVAEYKSLRRQNDDLRRQLIFIRTSQGIAQEARKHGFVKPGEISLVIPEQQRYPKPNK